MTEYRYYNIPYSTMGYLIDCIKSGLSIKLGNNDEINRFVKDYTEIYKRYGNNNN